MENQASDRIQVVLVFLLTLVSLSVGLGKSALFLEEPRRALVALEMLYSGNWFIPTIHNEIYLNKPPFFNWLIAIGFKVFGVQEWVPRSITLLSHLGIGISLLYYGKKYIPGPAPLLAACLYLVGADILFYFSYLGEIDVFFSFLVILGWLNFYHYFRKNQPVFMFASIYGFFGLAFLTKGLPALVFLVLSLAFWFFYYSRWKLLFSLSHVLGIGIFLGLAALYVVPFYNLGKLSDVILALWQQSAERTVDDYTIAQRITATLSFPFLLLKDLLPASIFLVFLIPHIRKSTLKQNDFLWFFLLIVVVNIGIYLLSPGSKSRYLYMFHPFIISIISYLYFQFPKAQIKVNFSFDILSKLVLGILLSAIFIGPYYLKWTQLYWIGAISFAFALILFLMGRRLAWSKVYVFIMILLVTRGMVGYIITEHRLQKSNASDDKNLGIELAEYIGKQSVLIEKGEKISFTTSFYLQRKLERIVGFGEPKTESARFFILNQSTFEGGGWNKIREFRYQDKLYVLAETP